eukprot:GHVN01071771.1.p1 GENE.GHVN01071771.1~~GHVN01071771.1.p1  ORF type:complete len:121 (+),score=6.63 GHVN01071771.1:463-825(+)
MGSHAESQLADVSTTHWASADYVDYNAGHLMRAMCLMELAKTNAMAIAGLLETRGKRRWRFGGRPAVFSLATLVGGLPVQPSSRWDTSCHGTMASTGAGCSMGCFVDVQLTSHTFSLLFF